MFSCPRNFWFVDSNTGELAVVDPIRLAEEQKRLQDQQDRQNKAFEVIKAAPMEMETGYDMYAGVYGDSEGTTGGSSKKSKSKQKARNPLAGGDMAVEAMVAVEDTPAPGLLCLAAVAAELAAASLRDNRCPSHSKAALLCSEGAAFFVFRKSLPY